MIVPIDQESAVHLLCRGCCTDGRSHQPQYTLALPVADPRGLDGAQLRRIRFTENHITDAVDLIQLVPLATRAKLGKAL
jgi:hypothetical protein